MNIGIIDADLLDNGTRHPNIALEKISGYYKSKGHNVNLLLNYENLKDYDQIYLSRVFNFTKVPINLEDYPNIKYGGTGFFFDKAPDLPCEIEHHMPDYHLYDKFIGNEINRGIQRVKFLDYLDYSVGFATRGCFRKCAFCVNKKYDRAFRHASVKEFYDSSRKYIYLWDDNILAYDKWYEIFDELAEINRPYQFRQGLDIRLLTDDKAKVISHSKYKGDFIFAFDSIKDRELIVNKIKIWKKYIDTVKRNSKFYLLCAYEGQDVADVVNTLERIKILMENQCLPYIMRFDSYKNSKYQGMYTNLARWCNQPSLFKKKTLREYVLETDGKGREDKMYASKRYLLEFEKEYPEVAKKYFDLRFWDYV